MKTIFIIAGPTAVGKTEFAIALAQHFNTAIISADSRQCYREMKIGVARPSEEELAAVQHYFVASHAVTDDLNAGSFEKYALAAAEEIFSENDVAVMTGGTGLYIKAFCEGIDPMPEVPDSVRAEVTGGYAQKGLIWLQRELQEKDPAFWSVAEQRNPQRLMRALEVLYATGKSILEYRTAKKTERPFRIIKIGLELPREVLTERIRTRVDRMMEAGQLKEVQTLLPFRSYNALQTVGYKELFAFLDGNGTREEAVEAIKINTRQYAKRQMTWFKKDEAFQWITPDLERVSQLASMI